MADILERYERLRVEQETLKLYALVDGYQYEHHMGERLSYIAGLNRPIFAGTDDEALAHAGPWLIDVGGVSAQLEDLKTLESSAPAVSWIITPIDLEGLSQLLQLKLDAELPDGRIALLRFYDPRVLGNLCQTMDDAQRTEFFYLIDEWHFMYRGEHVTARTRHV